MVYNLSHFSNPSHASHSWLLTSVGGALLLLGVWVVVEAILSLKQAKKTTELDIPLSADIVS